MNSSAKDVSWKRRKNRSWTHFNGNMRGACGDNATEDKQQQQTPVTTQQVSCTRYSSLSGAWRVSWKCFSGYRLLWKSLKQDWDMQQDRWWQWQRCPFGFRSAWATSAQFIDSRLCPSAEEPEDVPGSDAKRCQPLGCYGKRTFLMPLARPTGCNK